MMMPIAVLRWMEMGHPWVVFAWLHVIAFLLVAIHCMVHRREATSSILWIFSAWSFPFLGPLAFLLVGINRVHSKGWNKRHSDVRFLRERRARESEAMPLAYWRALRDSVAAEPERPALRDVNSLLNAVFPVFPLLGQNRVDPLVTGMEAYPRMLEAIRAARQHVHLQTFILGNDEVGREFLEALRERAEAGVTVRVLYDRFGSTHARISGLLRRYAHVPNLHIVGWTQANFIKRQHQINLHNHRKIMVVDGETAFAGGINLAVNNTDRPGIPADRDYHFTLRGPVVQELQYSFLCDWFYMTEEDPSELLRAVHFPPVHPAGRALVRIMNGGPASEVDELTDAYFAVITKAERQILAVTPYFVPPPEILRAFRVAALSGVDVRLVVPAHNNHFYAGLASRALYSELLQAGVRIYERAPPFIHAKAMVVDDTLAVVGTANLDVRSLRLSYETNLLVIDADFVGAMKRTIQEDMAFSREITAREWAARPAWHKIAQNFGSLLTPVL